MQSPGFRVNLPSPGAKYHIWNWTLATWLEQTGKTLDAVSKEDLLTVISNWKENAVKMIKGIRIDAMNEFNEGSQISFGLDGGDAERTADFEAIRGTFEENSFVTGLDKQIIEVEAKADALLKNLEA